jgi:hypothetical protein
LQLDFEPTGNRNEQLSVRIKIPKELGNVFEALAGAVFVDSGYAVDMRYDTAMESFFTLSKARLGSTKMCKLLIFNLEYYNPVKEAIMLRHYLSDYYLNFVGGQN